MVILGSSSPRRQELLHKIFKEFKVVIPIFDESKTSKTEKNYALIQSKNKAISLKSLLNPNDLIITADTIVKLDKEIFNKPASKEDAFYMLKKLVNKTHQVITGYTFIYKNKVISKEVTTDVTFNDFNDQDILNYINEVYVLDKAGSYAIQNDNLLKKPLIKEIKGSYYNVVGLPIEDIKIELNKLGII